MVIVLLQHLCCTCVRQGQTPCTGCAISFSSFPATCNVMSCVVQTFIFTQIFDFLLQVQILITTQPRGPAVVVVVNLNDMLPAYEHAGSMSSLIDMLPAYIHAGSMSSLIDMLPAYIHACSMCSLIDKLLYI